MDEVKCKVKGCRFNVAAKGAERGRCRKDFINIGENSECASFEKSERSKIIEQLG